PACPAGWRPCARPLTPPCGMPIFIKDAAAQKFGSKPRDGAYLEALIKQIYATPAPVVERVGALIK
ncbi:MAG TPA: hypothetical protein VIY51_12655, partial [Xanthobacteraceae bacterium]